MGTVTAKLVTFKKEYMYLCIQVKKYTINEGSQVKVLILSRKWTQMRKEQNNYS